MLPILKSAQRYGSNVIKTAVRSVVCSKSNMPILQQAKEVKKHQDPQVSMGERSGVGCLNLACKKWGSCINLKATDLHLPVLLY